MKSNSPGIAEHCVIARLVSERAPAWIDNQNYGVAGVAAAAEKNGIKECTLNPHHHQNEQIDGTFVNGRDLTSKQSPSYSNTVTHSTYLQHSIYNSLDRFALITS